MIHAKLTGDVQAVVNTKETVKKAKAAVKSAVFKVVRIGAKTAKRSLIRNRTGLLGKAIGSKVKVYGEKTTGIVGVRSGFRTTVSEIQQKGKRTVFTGIRGTAKAIAAGKGVNIKGNSFAGSEVTLGSKKVSFRGLQAGDVIWPGKYGKFVEGGHPKGRGKGAAKAFPFVKPAFEESQQTAPALLTQDLQNQVGK